MKARRKIYLGFIAVIMLVYIGLLTILYCSESADSSAGIQTFGDAFWYSVVTLTTVGYGDLIPVTPLGHAVGLIFLFLSAGIMVTMLGAVISFVTSEGMPFLMLSLQRRKNWYYFADCEVESEALAGNIYKEDPNALIIYGERRSIQSEMPNYPCVYLSTPLDKIVAKKKDYGTKCKVFLMKENDIGVNRRAVNLHELPVEVYARTTNGQDKLSGNINFFHSYECCARQYCDHWLWKVREQYFRAGYINQHYLYRAACGISHFWRCQGISCCTLLSGRTVFSEQGIRGKRFFDLSQRNMGRKLRSPGTG